MFKMLCFVRGLLFHICAVVFTLFYLVMFIPFLSFKQEILFKCMRVWAKTMLLLIRVICGVKYKIISPENLLDRASIYASKHQSAYDIFLLIAIIKRPVFILKKELLKIPLAGLYAQKTGMIAVDRSKSVEAIKTVVEESRKSLNQSNNILIFPEGTRTKPGVVLAKYKPGISVIYKKNDAPVIPIALNCGCFWPSGSIAIKPGTIKVEILEPIMPGLDSETFMSKLVSSIEDTSLKLAAKP